MAILALDNFCIADVNDAPLLREPERRIKLSQKQTYATYENLPFQRHAFDVAPRSGGVTSGRNTLVSHGHETLFPSHMSCPQHHETLG